MEYIANMELKVERIANKDMSNLILSKVPFKGSNTFARWITPEMYVVYSYGEHFPMYLFSFEDRYPKWYGNSDKFSRSTSRHQQQGDISSFVILHWVNTEVMQNFIKLGIAGAVAQRMEA